MSLHHEPRNLQPPRSSTDSVYLARGAAADVWKVSYGHIQRIRKDIRVNQKCLVLDSLDSAPNPQSFRDLWSEFVKEYRTKVEKWSSLCHPNVVRVFGFVDGSLNLEVDYCAYGCVRDYLRSPPQPVDKVAMIIDVVAGLRYLHEYDPPIVHGNINAGKLFVIHNRKTVVGEFGLTALCYPFAAHVPSISYTGFSRWLSPELLGYNADDIAQPTLASDIWALGCTLFEILTETLPYSKQKRDIQVQRQILARKPPGYCDEELRTSPLGILWPIIESCWAFTPASRPTVLTLAEGICRQAALDPDVLSNASRRLNNVTDFAPGATSDTNDRPNAIVAGHTAGQPIIISSEMSPQEIIGILVRHGCRDLSNDLDLLSCQKSLAPESQFYDLYHATLKGGTRVTLKAEKWLRGVSDISESMYTQRAGQEAYIWSKCRHRNVLQLLGLTMFRDNIAMISPSVENANLETYILLYPHADRIRLSVEVAEGLAYLHSNKIVHGDIQAANVVVSYGGTAMLTDFGNATISDAALQFPNSQARFRRITKWMAPELISRANVPYDRSDIYALGMAILEIITGDIAHSNQVVELTPDDVVRSVWLSVPPERPETYIPTSSQDGDRLWSILISCWSYEPALRPPVASVHEKIKTITRAGLISHV